MSWLDVDQFAVSVPSTTSSAFPQIGDAAEFPYREIRRWRSGIGTQELEAMWRERVERQAASGLGV